MGSKQSKRSVDISGKDGEAAGAAEVVAAGGEGRVEPIADVDTLKPQLNGDTPHIVPLEEVSEKEKQLENGTPEIEKDATTEKEIVVTNGSGGDEQEKPDQENGDAKPAPEADPKKNKKEKGTEAGAVAEKKSSEDVKVVEENKDEKTPETPVTEPITNGNSAPETPKEEEQAKAETTLASPLVEKLLEDNKANEQPDNVPLAGLSLDDSKGEIEVKIVEAVEIKSEETPALAPAEPASVPDTPISEVCAGQSPLIETTPPPLPSNPPPSSLTAFAETTMVPHLVDASFTSQSQTSPPITATAEIASSIVNLPLLSKIDTNIVKSDTESSATVDATAVDANIVADANANQAAGTVLESTPSDIVTKKTDLLESKEPVSVVVEQLALEEPKQKLEIVSESVVSSEITETVPNNTVEPNAPLNNLNKEDPEFQKIITNGLIEENIHNTQSQTDSIPTNEIIESSTDAVKTSLQNSSSIINEIIEGNIKDEENINGAMVGTDTLDDDKAKPVDMADTQLKRETSPMASNYESEEISSRHSEVIIENGTCEGESPSEALPPPSQDAVSKNGEGNCDSNEEISESFPLPPSELCRSESEASGTATPEPSQDVAPVAEVIVPEILSDKALIADIKEVESSVAAASEIVAAVAGAGDGAPSD